jgi:putative hydrolase of the HAD superfamily
MKVAVWDFDGTLARRPGGWTGAVLQVLKSIDPDCDAAVDDIRPFLQSGYPWHAPDIARPPGQAPDAWWESLTPIFAKALVSLLGLDPAESVRLARRVREFYVDLSSWETFGDTHDALTAFAQAGWTQFVLSNHVPELPAIVEGLGLGRYFDRVWTSAATGAESRTPWPSGVF